MLSETNKKKAKLIAQGISITEIAKEFNVTYRSINKLKQQNKEFADLIRKEKAKIFWEQNEDRIKKICNFVQNKFYKKIIYDELYNISYLEVFDNEDFEFTMDFLLYRLKYICRKELEKQGTVVDFTNEQLLNDLMNFE